MTETEHETWRIKKEISLGDLIAIVTAAVMAVVSYMTLSARVTVVEVMSNTNTSNIANTITEIKTELRRMNDKMERMIENGLKK